MVYNSRTPRVLICSGEHLRQGVVCQAVKARWSFDARFGKKSETVELLIEWIREIGSGIGLTARNTRLGAGQIGAPGRERSRGQQNRSEQTHAG